MDRRRLERFEVISFDCYGTLIDWESGILAALRPLLDAKGAEASDREVLELYAELESKAEKGIYKLYREVLKEVARGFGKRLGFAVNRVEEDALVHSLKAWRPFPDTVEALRFLKRRYRLAVVSNVDEDLFKETARALEVPFDWVVTAEACRAYKPSAKPFLHARELMSISFSKVLHAAQSLHHDIGPARFLGLSTVWVNRRKGKKGFGATPPAEAEPDLEVPDLASLTRLLS